MAMRKIGEATTDSNGIASFDYTGVGAGLLNLRAKLKDSTLQSVPYPLLDTIAFDSGILNDPDEHNSYWVKQYSSIQAEVTSNGTSILGGGNGQGYLFNKPNTTTSELYDWENNICIEFDVHSITGNPLFQIRDSSNNNGVFYLQSEGVGDGSHVKLTITDEDSNNFKCTVDGVDRTPKTVNNTGLLRLGFIVSTTTGLTFKNFKVYPI